MTKTFGSEPQPTTAEERSTHHQNDTGDSMMQKVKAILEEHTEFCQLGQDALFEIDPKGKVEQEILQRLYGAYQEHLEHTASDEQLEEWHAMDPSDKFDIIVENTA